MPAEVLVAGITWFADLCSPHTHAVEAPLSTFLLLSPLLQHPSVQIHKGGSLQDTNRMDTFIAWTLGFHHRLTPESHILTGVTSFLFFLTFTQSSKISLPRTIMTISNLFNKSVHYFLTEVAWGTTYTAYYENSRMPVTKIASGCPLSMCLNLAQPFCMTRGYMSIMNDRKVTSITQMPNTCMCIQGS